jgi:uncharacterized membrane protein YbhN (UPF0104 family)
MTGTTTEQDRGVALRWRGGLVLGVSLILGLLFLASRLTEIDRFLALIGQARLWWLLVALLLQGLTYVCLALSWRAVLVLGGSPLPLSRLLPVALAKLFADQVLPSAGLGGHLVTIERMHALGVARPAAMAAVLLTLIGYYASYAALALAMLVLLWLNRDASLWLAGLVTLFLGIAIAIPALALRLRRRGHELLPGWLDRIGPVRRVLDVIALVPADLLRRRSLLVQVAACNGLIFLLDAATLAACLMAVGAGAHPVAAFCALVMASIASTLSPVPMGLGSFEATAVAMLTMLGIRLEPAVAATLLLRGLTLWLPLLPGLVLMRPTRGDRDHETI